MKVQELIDFLSTLPADSEVIMSRDPEGNGFYKVDCCSTGTVRPQDLSGYRIDSFYSDQHTDEECCLDEGERKGFEKVVCIWP